MAGIKDLLSHKRTWALIIGLVFQALAPLLHFAMEDPNVQYIVVNLPYLLAGLWTALVLGQAYEDKVTRGATSALTVTRDPNTPEGGWRYALVDLLRNEAFIATLLGTVLAIVSLCVPWWAGLPELQGTFCTLAQLVTVVASALVVSLKYSRAHADPEST